MTNLESIQLYIEDSSQATAILTMKGITPSGEDHNSISMAWGMIYLSLNPNYKSGMTSITYTSSQLSNLRKEGVSILRENGIYYQDSKVEIAPRKW